VHTHAKFEEAVELFCSGRYLEAQEGFESLWHGAEGRKREFYQGWVLVAAALFHRDRGNGRGAETCVERAQTHWRHLGSEPYRPPPEDVLAAVRSVLDREWVPPDIVGCRTPENANDPDAWEDQP